jgi:hypothetical protein
MKIFLKSFFFFILAQVSFANNDSIINSNEKKMSIGLQASPFTYSRWSFPENQRIESVNDPGEHRDATKRYSLITYYGISLTYHLGFHLLIESGLCRSSENIIGIVTSDKLSNSNTIYKDIWEYKCKYIGIPIVLGFSMNDNIERKAFSDFRLGVSMDFVYYESGNYAYETIYDQNGYGFYHAQLDGNSHSLYNSFNRIVPFVYIGREHFNKKKTFSFKYGSMFTFTSIYQNHVTAQFYKVYKINPLIVGLAYHF